LRALKHTLTASETIQNTSYIPTFTTDNVLHSFGYIYVRLPDAKLVVKNMVL